jgi:hypothetical protein
MWGKFKLMWVLVGCMSFAMAAPNTVKHDSSKIKQSISVTGLRLFRESKRTACSLTIDGSKIKRSKGRPYAYLKRKVYLVPVIVQNNRNDTLKYLSMGCSWPDFYHCNNKYFKVPPSICEWNPAIMVNIPPHGAKEEYVPFIFSGKRGQHIEHFKVGLSVNERVDIRTFFDNYDEMVKRNIIWSNEVQFTPK